MRIVNMFRGKTFQLALPDNSYRIFIEGLRSPVINAAYSYALQKYMDYLGTNNPDELLTHLENPRPQGCGIHLLGFIYFWLP